MLVNTNIILQLPPNSYGRIAPRSGLASTHFIDIGAGVVDSDYRGEIKVLLFNHSKIDFKVTQHAKIAQIIVCPILNLEIEIVDRNALTSTERGTGGFGSTGI